MPLSSEAKIGISLGLLGLIGAAVGLLGAGIQMIWPSQMWVGWALMVFGVILFAIALIGGIALGLHHLGVLLDRPRVVTVSAVVALCVVAIFSAWCSPNWHESTNSLDRKLIVNCSSYVPRPSKAREDKRLYTTQISDPPIDTQPPWPFSLLHTYSQPGIGDVKWDDAIFPATFARCDMSNVSDKNLFRISVNLIVHWQTVVKTNNGSRNGDTVATTEAKSPEFNLAPQGSDFWYICNRSKYYVYIEKATTASVYMSDSDNPILVKLIPSSEPMPGIVFPPFAPKS